MIVTNIDYIPGSRITRHFGLVQGSTVRAKHMGRDILAGFKSMVGGEIASYTELLQDARKEAMSRMIMQAQNIGANAVINVRLTTASIVSTAAEVLAYGTAVFAEYEE